MHLLGGKSTIVYCLGKKCTMACIRNILYPTLVFSYSACEPNENNKNETQKSLQSILSSHNLVSVGIAVVCSNVITYSTVFMILRILRVNFAKIKSNLNVH